MNDQERPLENPQVQQALATCPPAARALLEDVLGKIQDSNGRRKQILGLVQEALSQLRLDMKYLVFDLEATRRERDHYRSEAGQ